MWDVTNTPPCRHNVLVVSHKIAGPNKQTPLVGPNKQTPLVGPNKHPLWGQTNTPYGAKQTPLMGPNKPPQWGWGSTLIPFCNDPYPTM